MTEQQEAAAMDGTPDTVIVAGELEPIPPRPQGPTMRLTSIAQVQRRVMQALGPEAVAVPLDATETEQTAIGVALWEQAKRGAA